MLFPKHRTDLIGCAVSVQRMLTGQIEMMRVPANPLDILAQQTVAAAALEPLDADRWFDTVRRAAPFATLPRSVYEATLEGSTLKAGRNGEGRREQVEGTGPAVVSVSLDSPKPRIPNAMGVMKAAKKPLTTWSLADLGLAPEAAGQAGSCTWVTRAYKPEKREKGETLTGSPAELAQALVDRLARKNLIEV